MKQLFFLSALIWLASCTTQTKQREVLRHVGDIIFDPKVDTTDFEPCHEDLAFQYYNFSNATQYKGEKIAIVRAFQDRFKPVSETEHGYVTIRFIVNCEGQTGWFRVITMDENYDEKTFSKELTDQLLKITQELDGWKPGEFDNENYDYYQYLTFKITNGSIENIMP